MPKEVKTRTQTIAGGPLAPKDIRSTRDDVKLLRELLKQSTPNAIASAISDSLETAAPEHLHGLKVILGPSFKSASTPLHCVRCHETYFQSGNRKNACVVECNEDPDPEYIRAEYNGEYGYYQTACCGKKFTEGDYPDDVCYTDWHTTNPMEVSYCEVAEDEKNEGLDVQGTGNVVTCRLKGCKTA